jgi:hypothetical protein
VFYALIDFGDIYNIRTLSVNIKFICTSFRNRQNSESLATMYVYCIYLRNRLRHRTLNIMWVLQVTNNLEVGKANDHKFGFALLSSHQLYGTIVKTGWPGMRIIGPTSKAGKLVRFKQKGQKQASFLAFHIWCNCWRNLEIYSKETKTISTRTRTQTGLKSSPKTRYSACF